MAKVTYMPNADDFDTVQVAGITFTAYEATDVDDNNNDLIMKLSRNPWFTSGAVDEDRKAAWDKVRVAHRKAKEHRAAADLLDGGAH